MSEIEFDKSFKIIILGDSQVGKTCILNMYVHQEFTTNTRATIGADFNSKAVRVDEKNINLNIWDTAGQEIYRNITNQYYRQAAGVFIVFDVTNRKSFESVKYWLADIKKNCDEKEIIKILIGNKIDKERVVATEEGNTFAMRNKMGYIETSAQSNTNIELAFQEITRVLLEKTPNSLPRNSMDKKSLIGDGQKLRPTEEKKKERARNKRTCCCGRDYSE